MAVARRTGGRCCSYRERGGTAGTFSPLRRQSGTEWALGSLFADELPEPIGCAGKRPARDGPAGSAIAARVLVFA